SRLLKRGFWWHGTEDVPFLRIKGFQWREHAGSPKPLFGIIDHIIRPNKAWVCSLVRHSGGLLIRRSRVQIPSGPFSCFCDFNLGQVFVPDWIDQRYHFRQQFRPVASALLFPDYGVVACGLTGTSPVTIKAKPPDTKVPITFRTGPVFPTGMQPGSATRNIHRSSRQLHLPETTCITHRPGPRNVFPPVCR